MDTKKKKIAVIVVTILVLAMILPSFTMLLYSVM